MNRLKTIVVMLCVFSVAAASFAEPPTTRTGPRTVLEMLAVASTTLRPLEAEFAAALQRKDHAAAEAVCRRMIKEVPYVPTGFYNLACLLAIRGAKDESFQLLEQAIDLGFNNAGHIQTDPDLMSLRDDPRFAEMVKKAAAAKPPQAAETPKAWTIKAANLNQTVEVEPGNVGFEPRLGLPVALYAFDPAGPGQRGITTLEGPTGDLLRQWWKDGTAAGNWGDLYDNRDADHSDIPRALFPQMTWIEYSEVAKKANLHWGVANTLWQDGVVIGNASVAATTTPYWRSMVRAAHQSPQGAGLLYLHYTNNKLYVYPCHVDYRPGRNGANGGGHGDVYFANTPYTLGSLGSSFTDQPHLQALAATMAAFRPEVKKEIVSKHLMAPTLQMIFRMSNPAVKSAEDYLSGIAHPPIFDKSQFDALKMVKMAHDMSADSLPPVVRLKAIEEDGAQNGRDFFAGPGQTEVIFDTPGAIARVYRTLARTRKIVVSAGDSIDANGKPLTYAWKVLQGDASKVLIKPLNDSGTLAEITVPWTPRFKIDPQKPLETNRIDVGVFANNGTHWSAPAFVTFFMLDDEDRKYDEQGRIQSVTYNDNYVDPMISLHRGWRDEYRYDAAGAMTGWTRITGDQREEFDAMGRLNGQPVRYGVKQRGTELAPAIAYEVAP